MLDEEVLATAGGARDKARLAVATRHALLQHAPEPGGLRVHTMASLCGPGGVKPCPTCNTHQIIPPASPPESPTSNKEENTSPPRTSLVRVAIKCCKSPQNLTPPKHSEHAFFERQFLWENSSLLPTPTPPHVIPGPRGKVKGWPMPFSSCKGWGQVGYRGGGGSWGQSLFREI